MVRLISHCAFCILTAVSAVKIPEQLHLIEYSIFLVTSFLSSSFDFSIEACWPIGPSTEIHKVYGQLYLLSEREVPDNLSSRNTKHQKQRNIFSIVRKGLESLTVFLFLSVPFFPDSCSPHFLERCHRDRKWRQIFLIGSQCKVDHTQTEWDEILTVGGPVGMLPSVIIWSENSRRWVESFLLNSSGIQSDFILVQNYLRLNLAMATTDCKTITAHSPIEKLVVVKTSSELAYRGTIVLRVGHVYAGKLLWMWKLPTKTSIP